MANEIYIPEDIEAQIDEIEAWWRHHRPSSPSLFSEELRSALDLISRTPGVGLSYAGKSRVRRLLLRGSRYHLYYELRSPARIIVLAVWSAVRGTTPHLRPDR